MTTKQEKARRMEIRKKIGSRVIALQPKTHRFAPFLVAHACFNCRVSFKVKPRDETAPCPLCRAPLAYMGRSFKAPKKSNIMQWRKVEKLWSVGVRFHTNQTERVALPKRWQDADKFLIELESVKRWYHETYRPRLLKLNRRKKTKKE